MKTVAANDSGFFDEFIHYSHNALALSLLDYLDMRDFNEMLSPINANAEEIYTHTAAINIKVYKKPAQKRETTKAAIHFVDSLMFGLHLPIALASDACLSKHTMANYDEAPTEPLLQEMIKILRNESFVKCLIDDFAKTGFGILGDEFASTASSAMNMAGAGKRIQKLGLSGSNSYLFSYDLSEDRFSIHPAAKAILQKAYRLQNLGQDSRSITPFLAVGDYKSTDKAFTTGCPLRHEWHDGAVEMNGIKEVTAFVADFCEDALLFMRSSPKIMPVSIELAKISMRADVQASLLSSDANN